MRRRIFFAYEAAERETKTERRQSWMTFLLGTLAQLLSRRVLTGDE